MKILYKFEFSEGYVFEINYDHLPTDLPKCERYKWFICSNTEEHTELVFDKMEGGIRFFKDGTVINLERNELIWKDYLFVLEECTEEKIKLILS